MTLSDLWPGFQGHNIFEVEYQKEQHVLKTKLLLHKRKVYPTYGMAWGLLRSPDFLNQLTVRKKTG